MVKSALHLCAFIPLMKRLVVKRLPSPIYNTVVNNQVHVFKYFDTHLDAKFISIIKCLLYCTSVNYVARTLLHVI